MQTQEVLEVQEMLEIQEMPEVQEMPEIQEKQETLEIPEMHTLYERLGGVYGIAPVVDDFIDRIMVDPRLNANPFVDEAHHRVTSQGFKYFVTEMVCWATGGPQQYTGRSMRDSHHHLMISEREWQVFVDDFQQTLGKFHVPDQEQRELKAIVESVKPDIIATVPIEAKISRRISSIN